MDVLLAVPALLISLAIINALGFGSINIAIAVGISNVASFARLMRSEVLKVKSLPYVRRHALPASARRKSSSATSSQAPPAGSGPRHSRTRHGHPSVSALSFLGLVPRPPPEWGF